MGNLWENREKSWEWLLLEHPNPREWTQGSEKIWERRFRAMDGTSKFRWKEWNKRNIGNFPKYWEFSNMLQLPWAPQERLSRRFRSLRDFPAGNDVTVLKKGLQVPGFPWNSKGNFLGISLEFQASDSSFPLELLEHPNF